MLFAESLEQLQKSLYGLTNGGERGLALVPTMGALHDGHLSLVRAGIKDGHAVMVSIFVNPTQFAAHEDLASYPKTLDQDLALLRETGASAVWVPSVDTMYPGQDCTRVRVEGGLTHGFEGKFRPDFFQGVATVVTKLLIAVRPPLAYFGEKDFQQLAVIRALAKDLLLPTKIVGCPTVREPSGLAMSSRNRYLSAAEQAIAPKLFQTITAMAQTVRQGGAPKEAQDQAIAALLSSGFSSVDYVQAVHAEDFTPYSRKSPGPSRVLAAATLGTTRLIDNVAI